VAGLTPLEAGSILPVAFALIAGARRLGVSLARRPDGSPIVLGLVATSVGLVLLTGLPAAGSVLVDVLPGFVLAGFGIGPPSSQR
jgi:hypothetical protein